MRLTALPASPLLPRPNWAGSRTRPPHWPGPDGYRIAIRGQSPRGNHCSPANLFSTIAPATETIKRVKAMNALMAALRMRYRSPEEVLRALGLDENLLEKNTMNADELLEA